MLHSCIGLYVFRLSIKETEKQKKRKYPFYSFAGVFFLWFYFWNISVTRKDKVLSKSDRSFVSSLYSLYWQEEKNKKYWSWAKLFGVIFWLQWRSIGQTRSPCPAVEATALCAISLLHCCFVLLPWIKIRGGEKKSPDTHILNRFIPIDWMMDSHFCWIHSKDPFQVMTNH